MEDYSRLRHEEAGYSFVNTPHITKEDLFKTSGHLEWFAEGMFPPMELDEGTKHYLKPMNCPMHILIYRSRMRSYRELLLRLFESAACIATRNPVSFTDSRASVDSPWTTRTSSARVSR